MTGETRKTEFRSASGEKLAAALELPRGAPRAFALFAHCFSCSKDVKAAREIGRALRAEGLAVLRFDFTGLGASEGDFANTNFSSNVDDLVSAADYLRAAFAAPAMLIGHSLGGAAAIVAAARIPEIRAVATIAAPAEAEHVTRHIGEAREEIERKGQATVSLAERPFTIKKQFLDDIARQNVLAAAEDLGKALLVMHAPLDAVVGVENAARIFVAAKHPKSFVSLDDADHLLSRTQDARYAARVLAAWASGYIGAGAAPADAAAAPVFHGGALARAMKGEPLAVELSIDGHPMIIDARREDGGNGLGPNPTRTLEGALAACGVMTVRMYARRKGWDVGQIEICVTRAVSEDAHAPHAMDKELRVSGPVDDAQRTRLLEIADKCPVHRVLSESVQIRSRIG